jgi:fructose-1,6-bisphosphatase/inositol monophosphatase family enzyme
VFEKELHYARIAARTAAENALKIQRGGVTAETKSDLSPVTIADKEGEQIISRILLDAFPDDAILGEEGASKTGTSGRRWIIDPIDGTRDFVRGNLLWCVLIGLEQEDDGEVQAGVVHFPMLGQTYFAGRGLGAYLNDTQIRCSTIDEVAQSVIMVNVGNKIVHRKDAMEWNEFIGQFWAFRSLGGALDAMAVSQGQAELWIEPAAQSWDFAPMQVIAEEAAARFFTLEGERSIHGKSGVVCAPGIEREVREFLSTLHHPAR